MGREKEWSLWEMTKKENLLVDLTMGNKEEDLGRERVHSTSRGLIGVHELLLC